MAARNEVYETFGHLLRQNASLRNLLKSDFVVINSLLANYYGIEGVTGDALSQGRTSRRARLAGACWGWPRSSRWGATASRPARSSVGPGCSASSSNDPPPPAPANVPQLSRLEGQLLTTRERIRAHQEQPQCASCHRKIDPIGFGLENFDAVGQWRTEDTYEKAGLGKKTWTIDPAAAFHNGPAFQRLLRDARHHRLQDPTRSPAASAAHSSNMHSAGPDCFGDEPLIAKMLDQARKKDFAIARIHPGAREERGVSSQMRPRFDPIDRDTSNSNHPAGPTR